MPWVQFESDVFGVLDTSGRSRTYLAGELAELGVQQIGTLRCDWFTFLKEAPAIAEFERCREDAWRRFLDLRKRKTAAPGRLPGGTNRRLYDVNGNAKEAKHECANCHRPFGSADMLTLHRATSDC
jgi:hypothetical protein